MESCNPYQKQTSAVTVKHLSRNVKSKTKQNKKTERSIELWEPILIRLDKFIPRIALNLRLLYFVISFRKVAW